MHVFGAAHQWCACAPKTNIMPNRHALMHKAELVLRIAYGKCAAAAVWDYALRPCLGARSQQLAAIGHQKGAAALVTALAASRHVAGRRASAKTQRTIGLLPCRSQ